MTLRHLLGERYHLALQGHKVTLRKEGTPKLVHGIKLHIACRKGECGIGLNRDRQTYLVAFPFRSVASAPSNTLDAKLYMYADPAVSSVTSSLSDNLDLLYVRGRLAGLQTFVGEFGNQVWVCMKARVRGQHRVHEGKEVALKLVAERREVRVS